MYRKAVLATSSGFLTNLAAGWFALVFVYTTLVDLFIKMALVIIFYVAAIQLQKQSYEL